MRTNGYAKDYFTAIVCMPLRALDWQTTEYEIKITEVFFFHHPGKHFMLTFGFVAISKSVESATYLQCNFLGNYDSLNCMLIYVRTI